VSENNGKVNLTGEQLSTNAYSKVLMLFRAAIALFWESYHTHNTLCGKLMRSLVLQQVVHTVTTKCQAA